MSMLHTPGPWTPYDVDGASADEPTVFSEKSCLATVWINDLPQEQAIANARLIAAAPDLLSALKLQQDAQAHAQAASNAVRDGQIIPKAVHDDVAARFARAEKVAAAAIAKAEGR